jgi:hypothetical protein
MAASIVISATPSSITVNDTLPSLGYYIDGAGLGDPLRQWRRGYAQSPWVDGKTLVSAVLDQGSLPLAVWVNGSSASTVKTRIDSLAAAVAQFTYTVTVTIGGSADVWTADPADWSLDGQQWNGPALAAYWQRVNLAIPVYPIAS